MNLGEKSKLYKMIEQDCNIEELKELKQYINYLLNQKIEFDNPEIAEHLKVLIMPLDQFIDDDYLENGINKIILKKKNRIISYVFDLVELKHKEVATIRKVGLTGYNKICSLLEKNNISLEFPISKQDEEKIFSIIKKSSKKKVVKSE